MKFTLPLLFCVFASIGLPAGIEDPFGPKKAARPERLSMVAVWDVAHYASTPDLLRYQDRWLVAFREASSAKASDGAIRVMMSVDGSRWSEWARLDHAIADFNQPRLHIMPDGKLLLTAAVTMHAEGPSQHRTYGWKSADGRKWEGPQMMGDEGIQLGPIEWRRGKAYSFGFQPGARERTLRGYSSEDELSLVPSGPASTVSAQLGPTGIAFLPDDTGVAIAEHADGTLWYGRSRPPYRYWDWKNLGQRVTDPRLVRIEDGRLVVSGADAKGRTSLFWLNAEEASLTQATALDAGVTREGAGMHWYDGALWTVYQAPNPNGAASIYLARIKLP